MKAAIQGVYAAAVTPRRLGTQDINLGANIAIKEYLPGDWAFRDSTHTVRPKSTNLSESFERGQVRAKPPLPARTRPRSRAHWSNQDQHD